MKLPDYEFNRQMDALWGIQTIMANAGLTAVQLEQLRTALRMFSDAIANKQPEGRVQPEPLRAARVESLERLEI